jgi:hypothetical protein
VALKTFFRENRPHIAIKPQLHRRRPQRNCRQQTHAQNGSHAIHMRKGMMNPHLVPVKIGWRHCGEDSD